MIDYFISDTHFFHGNILKFTGDDGNLVRPGFRSLEDMNECMITRWNETVTPQDRVTHLGDVSWRYGDQLRDVLKKLNGRKRLLVGNHDDIPKLLSLGVFETIELWIGFNNCILTHVPMHPCSLFDKKLNIHGHIHEKDVGDSRFVNVSVERTNYYPVTFEWIEKRSQGLV